MSKRQEPYPDRNGERRSTDGALVVRWAEDFSHAWSKRWSAPAKAFALLVGMLPVFAGIGGAVFSGIILVHDLEGLPPRVTQLERAFSNHIDTLATPGFQLVEDNTMRVDSLREDVRGIQEQLDDVRRGQEANRCWIMVAAGERSRFECSP